MKYFVLGALASGLLLYGMSMIYGATGTLDLAQDPRRRRRHGAFSSTARCSRSALVFLVAGIAFKFGAAPFHMWMPGRLPGRADRGDAVHRHGAEARRVRHGLPAARRRDWAACAADWTLMLRVLAVAVARDRQHRRDRADEPQAHARAIRRSRTSASCCSACVNGTPAGYAAAMFYAISYALMASGRLRRDHAARARAASRPSRSTTSRASTSATRGMRCVMLLAMVSLAGVPPLFGFFAKLLVLKAAHRRRHDVARDRRDRLRDRRRSITTCA